MSEERGLVAVDAQALIAQGIEHGLSIEGMERLMNMRRELRAEAAREQYFAALSAFQAACPTIHKGKQVYDKNGKPRYSYAPLDVIVTAVKAPLKEHGFSYTVETEQTADSVTAILRSHHRDGHSEETRFTAPIDTQSYMSAPQKVAAALTYAKRYAFCDAFGIMTGDEDNDAVPEETPQQAPKQDAPPAQPTQEELEKQYEPIIKDLRRQVDDAMLDGLIDQEQQQTIVGAIHKYVKTGQLEGYAATVMKKLEGKRAENAKPVAEPEQKNLLDDDDVIF